MKELRSDHSKVVSLTSRLHQMEGVSFCLLPLCLDYLFLAALFLFASKYILFIYGGDYLTVYVLSSRPCLIFSLIMTPTSSENKIRERRQWFNKIISPRFCVFCCTAPRGWSIHLTNFTGTNRPCGRAHITCSDAPFFRGNSN